MKFPKLFKKAAALVMAAVTTFSVLPATTAFAAGDIGTISFDFTYDRNGNAMRYNSSAVFDGYTAGGTGSYKYRMYVDGDNAFCIQPVSYTHLDVYKRQGQNRTTGANNKRIQ